MSTRFTQLPVTLVAGQDATPQIEKNSCTASEEPRGILDQARRRQPRMKGFSIHEFVLALTILALMFFVAFSLLSKCVPFPENGAFMLTGPLDTTETAPFVVITKPESAAYAYRLNVSDWSTNSNVAGLFVRGGQTARVRLPLGTYRITVIQMRSQPVFSDFFGNTTSTLELPVASRFYHSASNETIGVQLTLTPPLPPAAP